jgi:3-hydroxyisobutyrate dehydrogenase-like beta-hydroxyacid dehydrogenase
MRQSAHQRVVERRLMCKNDSSSTLVLAGASDAEPIEQRGGSRLNPRRSTQGEIGFVGLGHMGTAMAVNLAAAGHRVIAYVRRPDKINRLTALGLNPTTDISHLFDCEIVISMLPDDAAVRDVVFGRADLGLDGLAFGLMPGAIHLSMSTISSSAASDLASEHARYGQGYVAAPVFGNPDAAKARQLFIIAAGAAADVERCRPVIDSLGQKTFVVGADPGHANLIKLLGNMMTATAIEMLAEAVAVLLRRGLDPKPFVDILTSTMFGGRAHQIYGDKIVRQSYAPGFVMPLVLKDVRLALAEAEKAGAPMPSVGVVRDRLITGISRGYADLDWTALGLIALEEAGLHIVPPVALN